MEQITIDDFAKIQMRVGLVVEVVVVEKSDKLLRLLVRFGGDEVRTIFTGLRPMYGVEDLLGKKFAFVFNLAPRKMMGEESQGMIVAASSTVDDARHIWLVPMGTDIPVGASLG